MSQERFRIGRYWIGTVGGSARLYRFWYDEGAGEVRRRSLGTGDFEEAKVALAAIVLQEGPGRPASAQDIALITVLTRYYEDHSDHRPNPSAARRAGGLLLEFLDDNAARVSDLTQEKQEEFIAWLNKRGLSVGYISRVMSIIAAALNRAASRKGNGLLLQAPHVIVHKVEVAEILDAPEPSPDNWHPTVSQIRSFVQAIPASEATRLYRYARIMLGFGARPESVCEITSAQVNHRYQLIDFNAPDRRQTKKYRPTLPVPNRLWPEIKAWSRDADWLVHNGGEQVFVLRKPWAAARAAAKLPPQFRPKALRHFMATHLRASGVPKEQRDAWMGHHRPTTGDAYGQFAPDYLATAKQAADELLREVFRQVTAKPAPAQRRKRAING